MKNLSYKHIFKVFCIKLKINVQHVYKKTNKKHITSFHLQKKNQHSAFQYEGSRHTFLSIFWVLKTSLDMSNFIYFLVIMFIIYCYYTKFYCNYANLNVEL